MKRVILSLLVILLIASAGFAGGKPEVKATEEKAVVKSTQPIPALFSLKDIPEIKNKKTITMAVETGEAWDKVIAYIKDFSKKTGVEVNVERVASPVVYSKENVELLGGTGYYDVVYVETAWTVEWSDYLYKLKELANTYDPWGAAGFEAELKNFSPSILVCGQAYGDQMVMPFYTYHVAMFVRQDVFDNQLEKENFRKKYGYDLKPAKTNKELSDQGEFFTRKKGEKLMGKTLDYDIYGLAMMAGAYQINDEISGRLWGKNSDYATVVRDGSGNIKEFVITKENKKMLAETLQEYKDQLKYCSPGCLTANFDFVVAQMGEGRAIIQPHQFSSCFAWNAGILKKNLPEAKLGVYNAVGEQPYTGAWSVGVAKASKNPEAAYWLLRYLSSFETQMVVMSEGGQISTRMDVVGDKKWQTPENRYPMGELADVLLASWKTQAKYVPNYWYFNTKAGGKVYEMQMNVFHKPMSGETTVEQAVAESVAKTLELTSKFDKKVPIREEK